MLRDKIDVKYRVAQLQLDVSRPSFLSRLKVLMSRSLLSIWYCSL